jgi:hypothetical protein
LSWIDLRDFIQWRKADSALYRSMYPKSWAWDMDTDLLSAILHTLQGANWQRGGGKGARPKPVQRPKDTPVRKDSLTAAKLAEKRKVFDDELARRRAIKQEERRVKKQERARRIEGMGR